MGAEKITGRTPVKNILKESRKAVLDDKAGAFAITYSFITLILAYLGIRFIHLSLISFLKDIFPHTAPNRVNAINSVRLFSGLFSVIILAPIFTSALARGYSLAKGKSARSVNICFYKSVYLFSGLIFRAISVFFSVKLLFSYSQLADRFCEYASADRDTVVAVSVLIFSLLSAVLIYKCTRFISVIFLFIKDPDTKCTTAVKAVKEQFKGHFCEFVLLNVKFLPIFFGVVLSMGILLIYLIPHYTVSVSLLCDKVISNTKVKVKNYKITYRLTEVNAK